MATAPFPCYLTSYPPAATYHHPTPFFYNAQSTSYAAAYPVPASGSFPTPAYGAPPGYPYPPPASACTAAAAFSPAPAYGPTTAPPATTLPPHPEQVLGHPLLAETPTPNPPTATQIHGALHHFSPTSDHLPVQAASWTNAVQTPLLHRPDQVPGAPLPTDLCSPPPRLLDAIPTSAPHADFSDSKAEKNGDAFQANAAPTAANRERRPSQLHHHHFPTTSDHLPIQAATQTNDRQRRPPNCWFDSLQDELSKMRERLSSLTTSMVPSSASSTITAPTPFFGSASPAGSNTTRTTSYRLSSAPSTSPNTATAYDTPKVFGEMPPRYDFHNLSRKTVFLADGTQHSYYALPENYPLEQATAEPVFDVYADETNGYSTEFVDLLAGMHEQHTYEEDRRETEQPTKCFGKPTLNNERPLDVVVILTKQTKSDNEQIVVCANKASDHVFSEDATYFTSILAPCLFVGVSMECSARNLKTKPCSSPESALCCTHRKPQHVHNQQWNMWMSEPGRKEWDPGILSLLNMLLGKTASLNQVHSGHSCLVNKEVEVKVDSGKPIFSPKRPAVGTVGVFSLTNEQSISDLEKLNGSDNLFVGKHGIYQLLKCSSNALETGQTSACLNYKSDIFDYTLEQQQDNEKTSIYVQQLRAPMLYVWVLHERRKEGDRGVPVIPRSCTTNHPRDFTHMLLVLCASCKEVTEDCLASQNLMANTSSKVAALTWHNSLSRTPFIRLSSTIYTWDPGILCIIDRLLDKSMVSNQVQYVHQIRHHASYVWDPGTMLLGYKCNWWLFTEEKEMGRLIPEQWIFWCNVMNYRQIFQRRTTVSSLFHYHGIPLWLINFQVP